MTIKLRPTGGFGLACGIICAIIGTILCVTHVFGEWYADFDMEPTGLITGLLTIILYLLPFAISVLIGGGIGLLAGGFVGTMLAVAVAGVISFIRGSFKAAATQRNVKRESRKLTRESSGVDENVTKLQSLRLKHVNAAQIAKEARLCSILRAVSSGESIDACIAALSAKQAIVDEIRSLERKIADTANRYAEIGDAQKCEYYINVLGHQSRHVNITAIQEKCSQQKEQDKANKEKIKKFFIALSVVIVGVVLVGIAIWTSNAPYRELEAAIDARELTREQCEYSGKHSESSFYDSVKTDKGKKVIAAKLSDYHRNNDIDSALWLVCVQPNYIDGYDIGASEDFIQWIVEYAEKNGSLIEGNSPQYEVGEYTITVYGYSTTYLNISDGEHSARVEPKTDYQTENIPIVQ